MTELEYVLSHFEERFAPFRTKRIVIHGSREYAREIIGMFGEEFLFVGVMTRDTPEGPLFCGLPVLNEADIPHLGVDMILLTERVKYAEAVYSDLHTVCQENGIMLYDMYGLDEQKIHREIYSRRLTDADSMAALISDYDVVGFEVMDTLLIHVLFSTDMCVRPLLKPTLEKLRARGTPVFLSMRKSFPEDEQIDQLRKLDLFDDLEGKLIRRSGEDLSFRSVRETYPDRKILYIGIGLINECILPRYYGIDTYRIEGFDTSMPVGAAFSSPKPFDRELPSMVRNAIRESDLVSFDIFDTLLIRKTLRPYDVFLLTEHRGLKTGLATNNFAEDRLAAEHEKPGADILDIYDRLAGYRGWSEEEKERILGLELETERSVIVPRREIVELFELAKNEGKRVVLTSDMYLPSPVMEELLDRNGIRGYDGLFISCEKNRGKRYGLFEDVVSFAGQGRKILHIGDDHAADEEACSRLGIRSVILPSPLSMAVERGWSGAIDSASSLMERCMVGSALAELFSDPFQDPNLRERTAEERLRRFAVGVVGPLAVGHLTWMIPRLRSERIDGVLFLARDGYLPSMLYKSISESAELPPSVYFYASRRSAFLCCADDESVMRKFRLYQMPARDILTQYCGIPEDQLLPRKAGETDRDYFQRHSAIISDYARLSREGYLRYYSRCGLMPGKRYAVVDLISTGTTQTFLDRFLPAELIGFNYGCYDIEAQICPAISDYLSYSDTTLMNNYIELESFFTSTEPSVERISPAGEVVFAPEVRSEEELQEIRLVHEYALSYADDFFRLFYEEGEQIDPSVPENMFAAEGYHWVQRGAYDDWSRKAIASRSWEDRTPSSGGPDARKEVSP